MSDLKYLDNKGTFTLDNPDLTSYMYFPLCNEAGMMSSITPDLGGDIKLDQNTFLLEPVSSENLHNNKSSRNFWVYVDGKGAWSVTGRSAKQQAKLFAEDKEPVKLTAGIMWHQVERTSDEMGLKAVVTSFVPNAPENTLFKNEAQPQKNTDETQLKLQTTQDKVELTKVEITNTADKPQKITATVAIPLYARSATNIRDHRHVTSLLHRTFTLKDGVMIYPTLTFDERGHNKNTVFYGALAKEDAGNSVANSGTGNGAVNNDRKDSMKSPISFCPVTEEFIGDGGNFENPYYVMTNKPLPYKLGEQVDGYETIGAMRFETEEIKPGETKSYVIALCYGTSKDEIEKIGDQYLNTKTFDTLLEETKNYWQEKINVSYDSADADFDNWMHWVNFQPMLRRIYGCSFLPHHDYGKGGRGWRDLWQDCLALLIMEPKEVRQMLIDNFGGVRFDGTNATIIGSKQGEFIADRNNIIRVWMDHGAWPYLTTELYMQQTGDIEFLTEENTYFKDIQVCRGEDKDWDWNDDQGNKQQIKNDDQINAQQSQVTNKQKTNVYIGTILEHLLIQHLTAFYDVGEHNHIKIRGADWNDALDMADERGESVAFTALYGGNLKSLANDIRVYAEKTGNSTVALAKELEILLNVDAKTYDNVDDKNAVLKQYCESVKHTVSGQKIEIDCKQLADKLTEMTEWVAEHIRQTEWTGDGKGNHWFNGYYDNSGQTVEGDFPTGVRMMLTSQVFTVMEEIATDEQVASIIKAADKYLYDEAIGGYRLNTDFKEVKADLGRAFGFAFGHKENGAVFCHMATMYANALYTRGFAKEGYKVINTLYKHCNDYHKSSIYPGVPEYVNERGRGMYHYLTGAASWLLLTVLNQMYGIQGSYGALTFKPHLLKEQFKNGAASTECMFRGKKIHVTYKNEKGLDAGEYQVRKISIDGIKYSDGNMIKKEDMEHLADAVNIEVILQ